MKILNACREKTRVALNITKQDLSLVELPRIVWIYLLFVELKIGHRNETFQA